VSCGYATEAALVVWLELDALLSSLADRTNDAPLGSKLGYALYPN